MGGYHHHIIETLYELSGRLPPSQRMSLEYEKVFISGGSTDPLQILDDARRKGIVLPKEDLLYSRKLLLDEIESNLDNYCSSKAIL